MWVLVGGSSTRLAAYSRPSSSGGICGLMSGVQTSRRINQLVLCVPPALVSHSWDVEFRGSLLNSGALPREGR